MEENVDDQEKELVKEQDGGLESNQENVQGGF